MLNLLAPVASRLHEMALATDYVQADDTGLKVLDTSRKPAVKGGHLWCFIGYTKDRQPTVSFRYAPTWGAEHVKAFFGSFKGVVQGDGYGGYTALGLVQAAQDTPILPDDRRLGCAMHIRRKFEEAFKAGDPRGAIALGFFRKLYAIEHQVSDASAEQRRLARQAESLPLVDELYTWMRSLDQRRVIPGSPLAKAVTYAQNQEKRWRRCFESGLYYIDNGGPERQIRTPAQGRRAYLFAGSDKGAERLATAYTLVANCRIEGINPWEYLRDILQKLAAHWPQRRIDELLPKNWKAAKDPPPNAVSS